MTIFLQYGYLYKEDAGKKERIKNIRFLSLTGCVDIAFNLNFT